MRAVESDTVDGLLERAVVYSSLSLGLQEPSPERLTRLGARTGFPVLAAALRSLDSRAGFRSPLALCAARLEQLPPAVLDAARDGYWRLFGHTTRGLVCPCETEYGPDTGFHQPQQLADISGYYVAFGLHAAAAARVDHIACECEFLDFLCRKAAVLSAGRRAPADDTLDTTETARRTFLRDHLARFGCAFGARLVAEDGGGYYGALGHLLLAFLAEECAAAGVRTGPIDLRVRTADIDGTPMACGPADDLIQIQRRP